jgi:hypothetical protein
MPVKRRSHPLPRIVTLTSKYESRADYGRTGPVTRLMTLLMLIMADQSGSNGVLMMVGLRIGFGAAMSVCQMDSELSRGGSCQLLVGHPSTE